MQGSHTRFTSFNSSILTPHSSAREGHGSTERQRGALHVGASHRDVRLREDRANNQCGVVEFGVVAGRREVGGGDGREILQGAGADQRAERDQFNSPQSPIHWDDK